MQPLTRLLFPAGLDPIQDRLPTRPPPTTAEDGPGPAYVAELSNEALRALDTQRDRDRELLELQARLPSVQLAADEERREVEEAEQAQNGIELSEDEQAILDTLKTWDREIRAHEGAHVAAAGGLAGTPTYDTVTGPDGQQYAVGGHVSVDMSESGSPEANMAKMRLVKAAARAVADPSAADMRIGAKAERRMQQAIRLRASRAYEAQSGSARGEPADESSVRITAIDSPDVTNGGASTLPR